MREKENMEAVLASRANLDSIQLLGIIGINMEIEALNTVINIDVVWGADDTAFTQP